ncbi:MLO-like protein 2 isoform X2 [Elaeis guineensis]
MNSLLPCKDAEPPDTFTEEESCQKEGKVSLVSSQGVLQLQTLIIALAVFHVLSCLLTLGLGEVKMKKWSSWEEATKTLEFQLSNDPRRFKLTRQTSFGRRHLKFWSKYRLLLWLVCFVRQFTGSVSKADYFALRHGFVAVHFPQDYSKFDFRRFIQRSLDHDFMVIVRISFWIWLYAIVFIFFNAHGFYNHYWLPFIPLVVLLVVGTKLEVIITKMCLKSSEQIVIVPGTVCVKPDDNLFWFGRPQLLLHLIQFILIQNSFQLAFFTWTWYNFGLWSCFYNNVEDVVLTIGFGIMVQFFCTYVTLPLYALVTQMGSSMKETIFTDRIIDGLKNWHRRAKKNLAKQRSLPSSPSAAPSPSFPTESSSSQRRMAAAPSLPFLPSKAPSSYRNTAMGSLVPSLPAKASTSYRHATAASSLTSLQDEASSSYRHKTMAPSLPSLPAKASSSYKHTTCETEFKYPSGRLELLEVQKVVEEIIQYGAMPNDGEISFGWWRRQSSEFSTRSRQSK